MEKTETIRIFVIVFLFFTFIAGILVSYKGSFKFIKLENTYEAFENNDCGDVLINKGDVLLLYKNNDQENPLPFYNLDEYINYLEIQRRKGIKCPVLYLQKENDTQGKEVYRARPSPFNQNGGMQPITVATSPGVVEILDASRDNKPYNSNMYGGFDPYGLHVGTYNELDAIHDLTKKSNKSDNPMDTNWGGVLYTQLAVDSGKYDENNIIKYANYQPRGGANIPLFENPEQHIDFRKGSEKESRSANENINNLTYP